VVARAVLPDTSRHRVLRASQAAFGIHPQRRRRADALSEYCVKAAYDEAGSIDDI